MKHILLATVVLFGALSAQANCDLRLNSQGLSRQQETKVKQVLARKGYKSATSKGAKELSISFYPWSSVCVPSMSDVLEVDVTYSIESNDLNFFRNYDKRIYRPFAQTRLFSKLLKDLKQIEQCTR